MATGIGGDEPHWSDIGTVSARFGGKSLEVLLYCPSSAAGKEPGLVDGFELTYDSVKEWISFGERHNAYC
jgi:hypothetical protein